MSNAIVCGAENSAYIDARARADSASDAAQSARHTAMQNSSASPANSPQSASPTPIVSPHSDDRTLKTHPRLPSGALSENIASVTKYESANPPACMGGIAHIAQ